MSRGQQSLIGQDERSSSRKPTFSFTWKWQRVSLSIRPLMSVTSNQSRLCSVLEARPMAPLIASSMLSPEEPTISLTEYTLSDIRFPPCVRDDLTAPHPSHPGPA